MSVSHFTPGLMSLTGIQQLLHMMRYS